jgi:hypothetical protein
VIPIKDIVAVVVRRNTATIKVTPPGYGLTGGALKVELVPGGRCNCFPGGPTGWG